jgi:fructuronate reductase
VDAFLQLDAVFASLSGDARFVQVLRTAYVALGDGSPEAVAKALADA